MDFASVIRYHRKAAGISQSELGKLAGVGKTSVFDIEKGKAGVRLETLLRLCQALNIEISWASPLKEAYQRAMSRDGDEKS